VQQQTMQGIDKRRNAPPYEIAVRNSPLDKPLIFAELMLPNPTVFGGGPSAQGAGK